MLATLVLVGIVLPVAMYGLTLSLQAASRARHTTEAGQLAEAKLNELLVLRDSTVLTGSGDFGEDWPEYRWTSDFVAADYNLYEVTVTVLWTERGQDRSVALTTLIYPTGEAL